MATRQETEAHLSHADLQRLPVVQAALAVEHQPAPTARPALSLVPPAPAMPATEMPEAERTARPLHLVAHWVLMPTGGGRARLEMVWETPDPLPPTSAR